MQINKKKKNHGPNLLSLIKNFYRKSVKSFIVLPIYPYEGRQVVSEKLFFSYNYLFKHKIFKFLYLFQQVKHNIL